MTNYLKALTMELTALRAGAFGGANAHSHAFHHCPSGGWPAQRAGVPTG